MKRKRGDGVALCALDTKTGMLRRYERAAKPRWHGDSTMVTETHSGEVNLETAGEDRNALERFRTHPQQFFPEGA